MPLPLGFPAASSGSTFSSSSRDFLISGLGDQCAGAGFSVLNLYVRRCRRIIPAPLVVLIATWAIGWFTLISIDYSALAKRLIAGATFTSNLLLWMQAGYFDIRAEYKPLLRLWSLEIEEQYYIIWPLLLGFLYRCGRSTFVIGTACRFADSPIRSLFTSASFTSIPRALSTCCPAASGSCSPAPA
jgi:peptidoglycan/LPS O-acetylase OafA/YrhL